MAGFVIGGMMNGGNVDQGMAGQVNGGGVAPRVGYNDLTEAIKDQVSHAIFHAFYWRPVPT